MSATPDQTWWTANEIAEAALPDLPRSRQGLEKVVKSLAWRSDPERARRRKSRGGGWEYHWSLFPHTARKKLLERVAVPKEEIGRGELWAAYENLPDATRAKAINRLRMIQTVEALVQGGTGKVLAAGEVARQEGVSSRSIFNWFDAIEGVAPDDRLPYLAPRHRFAERKQPERPDYSAFMGYLKADYLRLEQPTFNQSYRLACRLAKDARINAIPPISTARRHLKRDVPRTTMVFAREGVNGLERCFPPQIRDYWSMTAMEGVNADCHKSDVFVEWPSGIINRPQIVAFQDIHSRKILSWRVDHHPNKVAVMAAFGDMVEEYGIPRNCLFDNGREFANKWMTGGAPTRFRFKVRDEDPLGVLPLLGIKVHWARPASGQSKPIERAFRDIASDVAKDPRFAGAYVGHKPDAKPENYRSHAVPVAEFLEVLEEGIREHNARLGRLTETAKGKSFDHAFAASYATAPIRKATEEQRRLWLMGQSKVKLHAKDAQARVHGNSYYADWMVEYAGKDVVARFDPENLHAGVYLYDKAGVFMGFAPVREAVGFFDVLEAKATASMKAQVRRAERKRLKELQPITPQELADDLRALGSKIPERLESKVVAPEFGKHAHRAPLVQPPAFEPPQPSAEAKVYHEDFVRKAAEKAQQNAKREETDRERFKRYLEIKEREAAGDEIGEAEARFATRYPSTAEYRALAKLVELHGKDEALG
ncbi:MAG: Mu transposase C-terminal domain-containing protein [Dinoroseobacter sp.]|nr:Mu transposase C-terminal domain-containing protein [Dinoroseobacter sp.]